MIKSRINIKISDTSSYRSMVVPLFDHIFTVYFLSIARNVPKDSQTVSLHVGNQVLSIVSPLKTPLVDTWRNTLISLLICHMFISTGRFARSSSALETRLSELCHNVPSMMRKLSTSQLLHYVFVKKRVIPSLVQFRCCKVIKIDYSPSVRHLARSLILCELNYIQVLGDSLDKVSKDSSQASLDS